MGWTKKQFIQKAYGEIGLGSYFFDLEPEQLQDGLLSLESMLGEWYSKQIMIGYPFADDPTVADLDVVTDVPFNFNKAVFTNLAIILAPSFGKTPSLETKLSADAGYNVLCTRAASPRQIKLPTTTPLGAGNKPILRRFVEAEVDQEVNLQKADGTFF